MLKKKKTTSLRINYSKSYYLLLLICFLGEGMSLAQPGDTTNVIVPLQFPIENNIDPTQTSNQSFDLGDPSAVKQTIVYDPITGTYVFKETIGENDLNYRNPSMMTLEEYLEYENQKALRENWRSKIDEQTAESQPFELPIKIESKAFENFFGSDEITIRPQGSVELSFGVNSSRYDNPILPEKQRKTTRFDFQQQIQLNLVGQIGTKLKIGTSYNTQAAFDFDNVSKLEYTGDEDQIVQKIALGNVALELPTSLIQGSQTLFGAKTQLKFGRATVDLIAASQKGKRQEINITGKAQIQKFEITADNYEANRHYFLNLYHHDHFNEAMSQLPIVNSTLNITRIEVWLTNRTNSVENTRNVVAFTDLGESQPQNLQGNPGNLSTSIFPQNAANGLYEFASNNPQVRGFTNAVTALSTQVLSPGPFQQGVHYEKIENARKLNVSEFTYNALLGTISLNQPLNNDEVLAVGYEYTYRGETFQVGDLSTDGTTGQQALILKLIKPTIFNPNNKTWDLMMKNIYSVGAYQVDQQGFKLDINYNNPSTSLTVPFFPYPGVDNQLLVTLLEMDKLNQNQQPFSDGLFDFVPIVQSGNRIEQAGTINTRNGRVYFTTVEPFGQTLADKLAAAGISPLIIDQVAFKELYDSTQIAAQQIPSKNRFSFKGEYQSSISSDIPLNALNVPEGAVSVTAGGIKLIEGQDYTVDYNLGRVKILNTGILESNTPIKISIESNSVFGFQAKSLIGSHFNYRFNPNFNVGATWMRMMERPVTQKVDIGSEPFKNNILGADMAYRTELPLVTKLVDLLPIISTKEKSIFSFTGEFAHLIPGSPKAINKDGTSYVDDFEGAQSTIDLKSTSAWYLASVPQGQPDLFPEANNKNLSAGFKRASLAWYNLDPLFFSNNTLTPQHIKDDPAMLSDSRMRLVQYKELFPQQDQSYGSIPNLTVFDLGYYPKDRGMYNYDTSATVDANGQFTDPEKRWGGIMRALSTNNFEQTNIEYIQFWMLDPFNSDAEAVNPNAQHNGGDLYFNLGNVSEDILPDSRKSFENGLPPTGVSTQDNLDTTVWSRVSTQQIVVNAFDTDPASRVNQDVGLDGWKNADELVQYQDFVNWVNSSNLSAAAKSKLLNDPSGDNFNYYRDDVYDTDKKNLLERYRKWNGMEGNSYTTEMSDTANIDGYPVLKTNSPDVEDINQDNNLSETEAYYQYKVSMRPNDLQVGKNYITSQQIIDLGSGKSETWYQFKVPIQEYQKKVNGIQDFRAIRFMRMFMQGFDEEVVLRFAKLEFVRGEWRKYLLDLTTPGLNEQTDPNLTEFNIGALNVQENSERLPIPYVIPPGIQREVDPSQTFQRQLNEQSLTLNVCNLKDGDARAAYRNVQFDVRAYKKLKMFAHAEQVSPTSPLNSQDLVLFLRLGTDFTENYYEYELPLSVTPLGTVNPDDIWPEDNNIEIVFDDLTGIKLERNKAIESGNTSVSYTQEFVIIDPKNPLRRLKVKGSPNLQGIRTLMIGVRNPATGEVTPWPNDDGQTKCAQIWVNELRLTDFVSEGGSAAIAQAKLQMADFANVSMSGNYSGINWGSVDSRVQERQRNEKIGYDFNTNVQLGQFFGKKARISVPFFYGYSVGIINPEYDPYNPDIRLTDYDKGDRQAKAQRGQDFTERKSYNFTNVRKELSAGAKPHFYNISNWSASYSYAETLHRDFNTEFDRTKTYTANLRYAYSFSPKPFEPFKNVKFVQKSKWLALVKDFNLYFLPKNVAFSNDVLRTYNERQIRNNLPFDYQVPAVYYKQFNWNRTYNLGYDITKNLKFTFDAVNRSIFDEGNGPVDKDLYPEQYQAFRDTIRTQLQTFGKTIDYTHNYSFAYNLPLDKIPALNWISANAKYSGSYNWQRAPLGQAEYGNIIQNNRTINGSAQMNFLTLYNKIPYFNKVLNDGKNPRGRATAVGSRNTATKPQAEVPDKEEELLPDKPIEEMTAKELRKWERKKRKFDRKKEREKRRKGKVNPAAGFATRVLLSVRNVSGTYTLSNGTLLPGFNEESSILGLNSNWSAPNTGFVFGKQSYNVFGRSNNFNIAENAAANGWLVQNENINRQFTRTYNQTINGRASLEPLKDLTIELTMNRSYSINSGEFYRWNPVTTSYESQSRQDISTLTYTTISFGTAFAFTERKGEFASATFEDFRNIRTDVSQVVGSENGNSGSSSTSSYTSGYGGTQQDVVIGAFITSFTNRDVNVNNINPVRNVPLPNWSINYNGLTKFPFAKKYIRNFVIRHGYSSTVSVTGMQTNLKAEFDSNGDVINRDDNNNFYASKTIQSVTLTERFSPLIGFDATWNLKGQGLITKFEIRKDRSATLSLNNNQVTEILGNELIIGTGYKFAKVKLPIGKIEPSPVNIRIDLSLRDNLTVIRKVVENTNQATAGQKVVAIKTSADYNIGQNLTIQFYYDQTINTPKIATSYKTGNLSTGLRLRFNLGGIR